jgi:predicted transcriptional regulator
MYSVPEGLEQTILAELTAEIVSAYVSHNQITPPDLGTLVGAVASQLRKVGTTVEQPPESKPAPAVPVRRSVGQYHLTCLVCGKKQKLLKRHLAVEHDLTPDRYRETFSLTRDTRWRRRATQRSGVSSPCNSAWGNSRSRRVDGGRSP